MFDFIDNIVDKMIKESICDFDKLKDAFRMTSPKTREKFRRTDSQVVDSIADDLYFNLDYLKSELDSILLLFNPKGIRIFLDKLKQELSYQDERQLTSEVKLAILQGKQITPKAPPDPFAYFDSSLILPYYEGVFLDFDLDDLTKQIVTFWLGFLSKVNELVARLEKEYSIPSSTKEEDILVLKPTFWGMSLNLNKVWKKYFYKKTLRNVILLKAI